MNILYLEDDLHMREAVLDLLKNHFPQAMIATAENGRLGARILNDTMQAFEPTFIITDYQMPDWSGEKFAEWAREKGYARPIILFTSDPSLCKKRELFNRIVNKDQFTTLIKAINDSLKEMA